MLPFQAPSPTRYDLQFTLAGIPIRVHPLFWLMTIILGAASRDLIQIAIWVVVVFVSIVIHEMGHALTMRQYGLSPSVVLYLGGGLAIPDSGRYGRRSADYLSPTKHILISLAGPAAGFLLALLTIILVIVVGGSIVPALLFGVIPWIDAQLPNGGLINSIVSALLWINLFWGLINLMPVIPLDGGNVAQVVLIQNDPLDGGRKSLWLSVIVGAVIAVVGALVFRSAYIALLYAYLAVQNYEHVKGSVRLW